jgi:hypothetical protein
VRLKLTEFIETQFEQVVIDRLLKLGETTGGKVFLNLWYDPKVISQEQVLAFVARHTTDLEQIGTHIHKGTDEHWTQRSWFNIRSKMDKSPIEYRHEYVYSTPTQMIDGIIMFENTVRQMIGVSSTKPPSQPVEVTRERNSTKGYKVVIRRINGDVQKQNVR